MNPENQWAATEKRLAREADSFGELLKGFRSRISPVLIGDREWDSLLKRARDLPATMAAYPFGFELPLHERRPRADLGVTVVGGTGPAAFFEHRARSEGMGAFATGIASLLSEEEHGNDRLNRITARKMMLEFDIERVRRSAQPDPGIFLRPAGRPIIGGMGGQGIQSIDIVLDALVSAVGWNPDQAEFRQAGRVFRALKPEAKIESFGVFPSRKRSIRLAVTGFRTVSGLVAFLKRASWSGSHATVSEILLRYEECGAFTNLGANLDVLPDTLGPTLGLSILARDRDPNDPAYWVDRPHQWTPLIESLREAGLAVEEKLVALADWLQGPEPLFGKSGPFLLMRGIHHVKLVLAGDRLRQVKVYVFMLLSGSTSAG